MLRPGGTFAFATPNARHFLTRVARMVPDGLKRRIVRILEGRDESDVFPAHYRFNTVADIHVESVGAGFRVERLSLTNSICTLILLGPLALGELLVMKAAARPRRAGQRNNLLGVIRKPG